MPADSVSRMDSNEANNEPNVADILGTSPGSSSQRSRTSSENSEYMARFVLPSTDGSPPKVLTLDEVAHVVKNIKNMTLAHEIVLNPEFKLQPYEPPENSLERRLRDIMHKAYWDTLREELGRSPPSYDQAIQLLAEIKECFPQILAPNNKRTLDYINEVLDASVIRQQAEQGVLDFKSYANFIIEIMAKSCAPVRDEAVSALKNIDDVVETFKGILETMTLMKLDMANFLLDSARNTIMANSVEYEKNKFKEYLEYYKFGFPATENWLQRNRFHNKDSNIPSTADQTIWHAYMELMDWPSDKDFPEILSLDKERILKMGHRAKRLCVCAALISICSALPIISQRPDNRIELAKQFEILLFGITDEDSIAAAFENIWLQVKKFLNGASEKESQVVMDEATETVLKKQLQQVTNKDGPVRALMWKRLQNYFQFTLRSKAGLPPPPPGFIDYKHELEIYANALKRIIIYNHSVFGEYFLQILTQSNDTAMQAVEEATTEDIAKASGTDDGAAANASAATSEQ